MDTQTDWVGVDDDAAQSLVMEHLSERGAQSAAFISSELTKFVNRTSPGRLLPPRGSNGHRNS